MLSIKIGTNTQRRNVNVDESLTPREILEENDIDYSTSTVYLDGATLSASEMNSSLSDLKATDGSRIITAIKQNVA